MDDIKTLTDQRGRDYGHPLDQFNTTQEMFKLWKQRRATGNSLEPELENVLNQITFMIIDKLVRTAQNPMKQDNYDDIQGYSALWDKCITELKLRTTINDINFS